MRKKSPLRRKSARFWLLAVLLVPGLGFGQEIGVYFDLAGQTCTSEIEPFGPNVHAWVIAIPQSNDVIGAAVRLELPPGIRVVPGSEVFPMRSFVNGSGSLETGLLVNFQPLAGSVCRTGAGIPIVEFDIADQCNSCGRRSNLVLHLVGNGADSLATTYPTFKICDPTDPEHHLGVLPAMALDARFNCTSACDCTTALEPATWTQVKTLFQDR